jgi:hypothetical protein
MKKSHPKSFFIRFQNKSQISNTIFGTDATYKGDDVCILQILPVADDWFLAEIIYKEDY